MTTIRLIDHTHRVRVGMWLLLLTSSFTSVSAFGQVCSDADHVSVKKDCSGTTGVCFEDISLLDDWLWDQSDPANRCDAPAADDRVLVEIGPGEFAQPTILYSSVIGCPDSGGERNGYVTFRGAGADQTTVRDSGVTPVGSAMRFRHCTDIVVEHISLASDNGSGLFWYGGGKSRWSNVDVIGKEFGWYDGGLAGSCETLGNGVHYWFSSRIQSSRVGYKASCDESWFYGTDLVVKVKSTSPSTVAAAVVFNDGDMRLFGSSLRIDTSEADPSETYSIYGVRVGTTDVSASDGNGTFHMHGGIINVSAPNIIDAQLTGLEVNRNTSSKATGSALGHVVETAYTMVKNPANTAKVFRTAALPGSTVPLGIQSPYQWPAATVPPANDDLVSISGYDQYIEIDCQNDGLCDQASPTERRPHLMIYDDTCAMSSAASPWLNTVTKNCRNIVSR